MFVLWLPYSRMKYNIKTLYTFFYVFVSVCFLLFINMDPLIQLQLANNLLQIDNDINDGVVVVEAQRRRRRRLPMVAEERVVRLVRAFHDGAGSWRPSIFQEFCAYGDSHVPWTLVEVGSNDCQERHMVPQVHSSWVEVGDKFVLPGDSWQLTFPHASGLPTTWSAWL